MRRIPSIKALQCFETTARLGSVSRAAEVLYLTQSAVSRQLKTLEQYVAQPLFNRERQRLVLTNEGGRYLTGVRAGLDRLETATLRLMSSGAESAILNIAAPPTFGTRWLIPKLPDFTRRNPGIDINFISRIGAPDWGAENIDVAIVYGDGDWPGLVSKPLVGETVFPVCSPALRAAMPATPTPDDLQSMTLLHIATRLDAWGEWLTAVGAVHVDGGQGPQFEHFTMLVQAAIAELGVALLPAFVAESEVAAGRLVKPFDLDVLSPHSYYLVSPRSRMDRANVQRFHDWIDTQQPNL